jgi:hypothetical protein
LCWSALINQQIRIYGMKFFDETEPYWGNITKPIVGAANGRLTARSVKIFADGAHFPFPLSFLFTLTSLPLTSFFLDIRTESTLPLGCAVTYSLP